MFKAMIDDGALDFLDCHRFSIDSKNTSTLERQSGELVNNNSLPALNDPKHCPSSLLIKINFAALHGLSNFSANHKERDFTFKFRDYFLPPRLTQLTLIGQEIKETNKKMSNKW